MKNIRLRSKQNCTLVVNVCMIYMFGYQWEIDRYTKVKFFVSFSSLQMNTCQITNTRGRNKNCAHLGSTRQARSQFLIFLNNFDNEIPEKKEIELKVGVGTPSGYSAWESPLEWNEICKVLTADLDLDSVVATVNWDANSVTRGK